MARRKRKYPLQSSKKQLNLSLKKSNRRLKKELSPFELNVIKMTSADFLSGNHSLKQHSTRKGKLKPRRQRFHNRIIRKTFSDRRTIDKQDPDLYVTAGVASSGKSETLAPRVPERTVIIDSDRFKKRLSRRTRSPVKRFPLIHAAILQDEADVLVKRSIDKSIQERRDTTLDVTFANFQKNKKIIERYRRAGYDIHLLGTQKFAHKAVGDATNRFLRQGRFVPPFVIAEKGNRINRNVMRAREITDTHIILDTNERKMKPLIVSKSKKDITDNFRNPNGG